jgi:hypothetical protein
VILICSILLLPGFALSQITNVTDDQSTPTAGAPHDYIKMLNETVNPANGSVSIRINVPVPKSRGITLPFSFSYDSNGVDHLVPTNTKGTPIVWAANSTFLSQGGWSYSLPLVNQILETRYWPDPPYPDQPCNFFDDYTYQDSNGGRHSFYLADPSSSQQACVNLLIAPITSATEDYYTATLSPPAGYAPQITLKDADATTFNFTFAKAHSVSTSGSTVYSALPDTVVDRNGNTVNFNDTGNGAFTMQDTVGRNAIVSNGFGSTGNTISVSGLSNPYSITWETIPLTGTYDAGAQLLQGNGNCWTSFPKLTGSVTVIKSILRER